MWTAEGGVDGRQFLLVLDMKREKVALPKIAAVVTDSQDSGLAFWFPVCTLLLNSSASWSRAPDTGVWKRKRAGTACRG